jgi:hypothetical protein
MEQIGASPEVHQPAQGKTLKELAYKHELDLLERAEKSSHRSIRRYAMRSAKQERKHLHRQEARISSRTALTVSCIGVLLATAGSLYTFMFYPRPLALELSGVAFGGALLLGVLCFVFSDKLEAGAAVEFFDKVLERLRPSKRNASAPAPKPAQLGDSRDD